MMGFGCFSPIIQWLKAPFRREEEPRILEIVSGLGEAAVVSFHAS
jgi:hypothetical protein